MRGFLLSEEKKNLFFTQQSLKVVLQRRHLVDVLLFMFGILNQLHDGFRQRFAPSLCQPSQALPDNELQVD